MVAGDWHTVRHMLTRTALNKAIQELAPPGVAYSLCNTDGAVDPLWPAELSVAASMGEKRRREFTAGRHCARQALVRLGQEPVALPIGPGRAPVWPPGIIGSISHTDEIAIAAVARQTDLRSLGIDVESADPLEPGLLELVCRDDERAALTASGMQLQTGAKLIFSAKESVYKCLWPVSGVFLEFHAIGIRIDPVSHRFTAYSQDRSIEATLRLICGAYRKVGGVLLSCAWLDGADAALT
jgi:4'-phosphopantetheinyl transferase EntD